MVVDLGSGGGIDIFLAAAKVGPTGRAIGLDGSAVISNHYFTNKFFRLTHMGFYI